MFNISLFSWKKYLLKIINFLLNGGDFLWCKRKKFSLSAYLEIYCVISYPKKWNKNFNNLCFWRNVFQIAANQNFIDVNISLLWKGEISSLNLFKKKCFQKKSTLKANTCINKVSINLFKLLLISGIRRA